MNSRNLDDSLHPYQPAFVPPLENWLQKYQTVFLMLSSDFTPESLHQICSDFLAYLAFQEPIALVIAYPESDVPQPVLPISESIIPFRFAETDLFQLLASVHVLIIPEWIPHFKRSVWAALLMNRPIIAFSQEPLPLPLPNCVLRKQEGSWIEVFKKYVARENGFFPRQILLSDPSLRLSLHESGVLNAFPTYPSFENVQTLLKQNHYSEAGHMAAHLINHPELINIQLNYENWFELMFACVKGNKYIESIQIGRKLMDLNPSDFQLSYHMASAFKGLGDFENANLYFERALESHKVKVQSQEMDSHSFENIKNNSLDLKKLMANRTTLPVILFNPISYFSAGHSISAEIANSLSLPLVHLSTGLEISDVNTLHVERTLELLANQQGALAFDRWPATTENLYLISKFFQKMVVHIRDPRSSLVSAGIALHHLRCLEKNHLVPKRLKRYLHFWNWDLRLRNFAEIAPGPTQIEYALNSGLYKAILNPIVSWLAIETETPAHFQILFCSFEQYLNDKKNFYEKIMSFYSIENDLFLFSAEPINFSDNIWSGNLDSQADKFLFRRGKTDEWLAYCTEEQANRLTSEIPENLFERFGWKLYN